MVRAWRRRESFCLGLRQADASAGEVDTKEEPAFWSTTLASHTDAILDGDDDDDDGDDDDDYSDDDDDDDDDDAGTAAAADDDDDDGLLRRLREADMGATLDTSNSCCLASNRASVRL